MTSVNTPPKGEDENVETFCYCYHQQTVREAFGCLKEEVREFFELPSRDELSDCCFAVGRLVASLNGSVYIPMPYDERHWQKMEERMNEYGCIRSKRHLRNGRCPSLPFDEKL